MFILILALFSISLVDGKPIDDECSIPSHHKFDFVIVGGGSAGSVVASRLSENRAVHVLLIEAGSEPTPVADIPLRTRDVLADFASTWYYPTEPQTNCCKAYTNQVINLPSGKGLGGTSNVNSMIYTRGNRYDYNRLEELGIKGWSYNEVLKVFNGMENYKVLHRREDHQYHGYSGHQIVSSPEYKSAMAEAFLQAGDELNYYRVDVNAKYQIGFTPPPVNIKDGVRWGSYHAFLEQAQNRPNLHVVTNAIVTKIIFDQGKPIPKAVGVRFTKGRSNKCKVWVRKEVIVSAGALRSPQLLMVSGVGPREELDKFNIDVVHELPGVGQNLKDHVLIMGVNFNLDQHVSINFTRLNTSQNVALWEKTRTGPMTSSNGVEGISFFESKSLELTSRKDHPSFEISFFSDKGVSPDAFSPEYKNSFIFKDGKDAVTLIPILLQAQSVGEVRLRSNDATDYPVIDPKYLSNPVDERLLLEVLRIALSIGKSNSFKKFGAELVKFGSIPGCDGLVPDSDDFWLCFIRRFSCAGYHFTGTCKMSESNDSMGVVDSKLRVHGVSGLRIADASVFPESPAGHTHAVALLIGERAAEFISQEYRL